MGRSPIPHQEHGPFAERLRCLHTRQLTGGTGGGRRKREEVSQNNFRYDEVRYIYICPEEESVWGHIQFVGKYGKLTEEVIPGYNEEQLTLIETIV